MKRKIGGGRERDGVGKGREKRLGGERHFFISCFFLSFFYI